MGVAGVVIAVAGVIIAVKLGETATAQWEAEGPQIRWVRGTISVDMEPIASPATAPDRSPSMIVTYVVSNTGRTAANIVSVRGLETYSAEMICGETFPLALDPGEARALVFEVPISIEPEGRSFSSPLESNLTAILSDSTSQSSAVNDSQEVIGAYASEIERVMSTCPSRADG
jgi:hypothetical protein